MKNYLQQSKLCYTIHETAQKQEICLKNLEARNSILLLFVRCFLNSGSI